MQKYKVHELASRPESNIVDLSKLTVEELLEEVTKRMHASPDTQLETQVERYCST